MLRRFDKSHTNKFLVDMDNRDIIKYLIKVMALSPSEGMFMYAWVVINSYVIVVLEERNWADSFEKEHMRKSNRNWYLHQQM